MKGMSTVPQGASCTGAPRMPPARAISSTPAAALKVLAINSAGWVPILIEIGNGSPRARAFSANLRRLLGVTMSMPVVFLSFTKSR